jgi:hypothetical protein
MRIPKESEDQKALAELLDRLGLDWFHVPNEGKRDPIYAVELKRRGVKAGVPDNFIFNKPPKKEAQGLVIELKRKKGGRVDPEQDAWLQRLKKHGWHVAVCHGIDEAIQVLRELGYLPEVV